MPLAELWGGDQLRSGGAARIEVLHPPRRGILGSDNANSIVLAVEFAGRRLLLTGDLESPGLDDVMAESPYDCDLLLAPHHGSAFSLAPKLTQSAWFRVHNRDDAIPNMYFVGAGTHPGAGIPGVVGSAKATAALMLDDLKRG